jgi:hypothetical protein
MSDVRNRANNLNPDFPIAGVNNSSQGFRDNTAVTQQALFQASDELDKIQKTQVKFLGDALGTTPTLGSAVVVGSADPVIEVTMSLASIYNGELILNSATKDISITLDNKGRVVATTLSDHVITWAAGHATGSQIGSETSGLGSGSGTFVLPTFTFNALGRLTATGKQTISYGLLNQTLETGGLLIGGASNKSTTLSAPTGNGSYNLVFTGGAFQWVTANTGTVSGITAGEGIAVDSDPVTPTVKLDLSNATESSNIGNDDLFIWQGSSDHLPKKVTFANLQSKIVKVAADVDPELGGNLDLKNFYLTSSNSGGVRLLSADSAPKSTVSVREDGIMLQGSAGAPIVLSAPSMEFNGLQWPVGSGTSGQYLTVGPSNTLIWSSPAQFYQVIPNTLFVSSAGDDTSGNGSLNDPYQTINKALQSIPNNSTNNIYTIMLLGGIYEEDVQIVDKTNIALEGFFGSTKSVVKGYLQVMFNVERFLMNNISVDTSFADTNDFRPTFSIVDGVSSAEIKDCDFLRGSGDKSDLPVIDLDGIIVGDVTFTNCMVQGKISNRIFSDDGGRVVFQNSGLPSGGWTGLEVSNGTDTLVSGAPLMKGIRHNGGILKMENIGAIAPESYTISINNPSLPIWENGEPVFVLDQNDDPVVNMDEDDNIIEVFLLDPQGNTIDDPDNAGESLKTIYVQAREEQPDTIVNYTVGLYSTANNNSGVSRLELNNVIFSYEGVFSKLYKSGNCEWSFNRVKRRSDQDFISGPRMAYDVQPDEGHFLAHYTASGANLRYEDDNSVVDGGVIDPNSGKSFQVTLTGSSTITIKTPLATTYAPGPLPTSGEMYSEVLIIIKQDVNGGRNVTFQDDLSQGITWLTTTAVNSSPNGLTFYLFRYFSRLRKWVGQRMADAGTMKVTPQTGLAYTLTANDAGAYIRRSNSSNNQVVVPTNASVGFAVGTEIKVVQIGTGQTEIVPAAGVVINTPVGRYLRKQFSQATLTKVAANTWDLFGDLDDTKLSEAELTSDTNLIKVDDNTVDTTGKNT